MSFLKKSSVIFKIACNYLRMHEIPPRLPEADCEKVRVVTTFSLLAPNVVVEIKCI